MALDTRELPKSLRQVSAVDSMLAGYLVLCLLLGGASAGGVLANALLQLLAVLQLCWFALRSRTGPILGTRQVAAVALLAFGLMTLLVVPLPASFILSLPGRQPLASAIDLLGLAPEWLTLSLDKDATLSAMMALLPGVAIAVATLQASEAGRRRAATVVIATTVAGLLLGMLQLTNGSLYLYAITNRGQPVGFFSNANHMATLLLIAMPMTAAIIRRASRRRAGSALGRRILLGSIFLLLCVGILLNASVAGLGLLLPVVVASYLVARHALGLPISKRKLLVAAGLLMLIVVVVLFGPLRHLLLDRTLSLSDPTTRRTIWTVTVEAIRAFFPFPTGPGTFEAVYHRFENLDLVGNTYVNHAHCDYLELLLEFGLPGALAVACVLLWYLFRLIAIWRAQEAPSALPKAASVAFGVVLLHSIVDYPARTAAILAVASFSAAILMNPFSPAARRPHADPKSRPRQATADDL